MVKKQITNIASVGIIYPKSYPSTLFIEIKDDGHPLKLVRRQLCFIGGNWIGENAKYDKGPMDTFCREVLEELSFERPCRTSVELMLLGQADAEIFQLTPIAEKSPNSFQSQSLRDLRSAICENAVPFGTFLNTVSKAALDSADPENKRDGFTSLACYYAVPLDKAQWNSLETLQEVFGNLSNESITLITSLDEILASGVKTAFGHDQVLQRFFLAMGLSVAKQLPMVEGIQSENVGTALATYDDYLQVYDIAKKP